MADRNLTVRELKKLLEAHGCTVEISGKNFFKATRQEGGLVRRWTQHAHKGIHDRFDRIFVGRARRRLGFADMSDEEFYKPLG